MENHRGDRYNTLLRYLHRSKQLEDDPSLETVELCRTKMHRDRPAFRDDEIDEEMTRQAADGMDGCFRRFNAAVERHRGLQRAEIGSSYFPGLDVHHEGLERLFSAVLPNHPTLYGIRVVGAIPPSLFKLLVEGITTIAAPEAQLVGTGTSKPAIELSVALLGPVALEDVARMVRNNAPVGKLFVAMIRWAASDAQLFCDALTTNSHLRSLELLGTQRDDSLPSGGGSWTLRRLFYAPLPATDPPLSAFQKMIWALRNNDTLEEIDLPERQHAEDEIHEVCQLLSHHNFTLRRIGVYDEDPSVAELLRANALVRNAHHALLRSQYKVARIAAWPRAMGRISSKPKLLYKFLRRGNCDGLDQHLASQRNSGKRGSSGDERVQRPRKFFWFW